MKRRSFLKLALGALGIGTAIAKATEKPQPQLLGLDLAAPGTTDRSVPSGWRINPEWVNAPCWEDPPGSGIWWRLDPEPMRFQWNARTGNFKRLTPETHAHAFNKWEKLPPQE